MKGQMARALTAASAMAVAMMAGAMMPASVDAAMRDQGIAVGIGIHMHLSDATVLVKTTGIHDNNVVIARGDVLKRQDDTLTLEADDQRMTPPQEVIIEIGKKEALVLDEADDVDFA